MKRFAIALAATAVLLPALASAQTNLDYSRLYLSDSPTSQVSFDNAPSNSFDNTFYLVMEIALTDAGQQAAAGIKAWDAALNVPAEIQVFQKTLNPGTSLNVGDEAADDWSVGTGGKVFLRDMPINVLTYTYGNFNNFTDAKITLAPFSASATVPPAPSWVFWPDCPESNCDEILPFSDWEGNDLVINCVSDFDPLCPVATEENSWGAVKSRF